MSRIRSTGNKDTELRLIVLMRAAGIRGWRRGVKLRFGGKGQGAGGKGAIRNSVLSVVKSKSVTIRPDFVFPKQRLAVFVDGCFWHGCPQHATWPRNRAAFWFAKLSG